VTGSSRTPAPAPPWRVVLANTLRLWWQRRVSSPGPDGVSRRRIQSLRVIVSLLVISLVVVSATAIHLAQTQASTPGQGRASHDHTSTAQHTATAPAAMDTEALRAASQSRQQAAGWVADQVGRNVIVACDPLMCTALQRHGFPAANLTPVIPGTGDPLGSGVVVSTQAVRDALGSRLTTVYAPLVIASFGTGQSLVEVLATAPDGATAYQAAEQADMQARQLAGRQLLHNKNLHLSKGAAADLASGQVDSRLLITLAALARRPVTVLSFGESGPGAASSVPLRAMEIRSAGPRYLQGLLAFLAEQRAPLLAAAGVSHAGKITIVHVKFTAPSLTGLLAKT
jgi:hypothetical protein